jgi:RimJ/RimL family protein N-acetyltransferase
VAYKGRYVALAWILDQTERFDALGAHTLEPYRRLGLGRSAAAALLDHVGRVRVKEPVWSAPEHNDASRALARALGFRESVEQTVWSWPAGGAG